MLPQRVSRAMPSRKHFEELAPGQKVPVSAPSSSKPRSQRPRRNAQASKQPRRLPEPRWESSHAPRQTRCALARPRSSSCDMPVQQLCGILTPAKCSMNRSTRFDAVGHCSNSSSCLPYDLLCVAGESSLSRDGSPSVLLPHSAMLPHECLQRAKFWHGVNHRSMASQRHCPWTTLRASCLDCGHPCSFNSPPRPTPRGMNHQTQGAALR